MSEEQRVESEERPKPFGDWMQTYSGRQFWPLDPRPEDVCIEDIAHALSLISRFGGHTRGFYSVADHSVFVSKLVPGNYAAWGLLHDAAEAYIGDIIRPLKRFWYSGDASGCLVPLRKIEERVQVAICQALGFNHRAMADAPVRHADEVALATEARDIMGGQAVPWGPLPPPHPRALRGRSPEEAERAFLARWYEVRPT
jgi:hypothetical protein